MLKGCLRQTESSDDEHILFIIIPSLLFFPKADKLFLYFLINRASVSMWGNARIAAARRNSLEKNCRKTIPDPAHGSKFIYKNLLRDRDQNFSYTNLLGAILMKVA